MQADDYSNDIFSGGLAGTNASTGKIIASSSTAKVSSKGQYTIRAGGLVGKNDGFITNSEASGEIHHTISSWCSDYRGASGGIAGENNNQILNCYYTGSQTISIAGAGSGVVA